MRRREFIKAICCTATAWPVIATAQQPALPIVAFVGGGTREEKFPPAGPHDKPEQRDAGKTPGAGALPDDDDKEVTPGTG